MTAFKLVSSREGKRMHPILSFIDQNRLAGLWNKRTRQFVADFSPKIVQAFRLKQMGNEIVQGFKLIL
ncbi:MAG: hypothetical protein U0694_00245 [Anaerolineae bacterium]